MIHNTVPAGNSPTIHWCIIQSSQECINPIGLSCSMHVAPARYSPRLHPCIMAAQRQIALKHYVVLKGLRSLLLEERRPFLACFPLSHPLSQSLRTLLPSGDVFSRHISSGGLKYLAGLKTIFELALLISDSVITFCLVTK